MGDSGLAQDQEDPITEEAVAAFAAFFEQWKHSGLWRFEKEFRKFTDRWDWIELFGGSDRRRFSNRTLWLYKSCHAVAYARERKRQLSDIGYDLIVYKCRDIELPFGCGSAHGELDRLVFRPDDPVLLRYLPPSRWDCNCDLRGARSTGRSLERMGADINKPVPIWALEPDPQTGLPQRVDPIFAAEDGPSQEEIIRGIVRGEVDGL